MLLSFVPILNDLKYLTAMKIHFAHSVSPSFSRLSKLLPGFFLLLCTSMLTHCGASRKSKNNRVTITTVDNETGAAAAPQAASPASPQPIQEAYARKLGVPAERITNVALYRFINNWLNTKYKWGGETRDGIDCSAFVRRLYNDVYNIQLPRTSIEQFYADGVELYRNDENLHEGDLIFFKTLPKKKNAVTHVGFYLHNRYFVNSSSSQGVSIASLDDPYWKKKYVASGRLKKNYYQR